MNTPTTAHSIRTTTLYNDNRRFRFWQHVATCLCLLLVTVSSCEFCSSGFSEPSETVTFGLLNQTEADGLPPNIPSATEQRDLNPNNLETQSEGENLPTPGFNSLDSMLHWAIQNSDTDQLKAEAQEVQTMSPEQLALKRQHVRDVVEAMRMPSNAELMKVAIADLLNESVSRENQLRALYELLQLVEPIYNANDLHKIGGLAALTIALQHSDSEVRAMGAWVVGKAAQNNPTVQKQVLDEGMLNHLFRMTDAHDVEEAGKALYAVSAGIRNHVEGQQAFYELGGVERLTSLMDAGKDLRLRKKAVILVGALAQEQDEGKLSSQHLPHKPNAGLLHAVLDLILLDVDLDLQQKALHTLQNLVDIGPNTRKVLREDCGVESVLQHTKATLQDIAASDSERAEYAEEVNTLRQDVERRLFEYK